MSLIVRTFSAAVLLAASASIMAAPKLTPQECNDYPFAQTNGPLTHHQVMQELAELEAVGYQPAQGEDPDYPGDLEQAQRRLWKEYARDCTPHQSMAMRSASTH
jgi:Domain of unknown function (DUF4148)